MKKKFELFILIMFGIFIALKVFAYNYFELGKVDIDIIEDNSSSFYSITYNLDGGNNFENAPVKYESNSETIILGTPIKAGYTFKGWYTDSEFNNSISEITSGSFGDKVLYAKWNEDVDLILFWGQSNMVGSVGKTDEEKVKDTRDLSGIISNDILEQYQAYNYVSVQVEPGTAYEYKVLDGNGNTISNNGVIGKLDEITSNTKIYGETITYQDNSYFVGSDNSHALSASKGTNMIPEFVKTYYNLTGHKAVAVSASHGGMAIKAFFPSDEGGSYSIYETLIAKYNDAVKYLEANGYEIKNRFYVAYQGCSDAGNANLRKNYVKSYKKIHNKLKNELGIQFGSFVYIGRINSSAEGQKKNVSKVKLFHDVQKKLISSDIIAGSDLAYNSYVNGNSEIYTSVQSNSVHVDSAGLSQIGMETATSIFNNIYDLKNNGLYFDFD